MFEADIWDSEPTLGTLSGTSIETDQSAFQGDRRKANDSQPKRPRTRPRPRQRSRRGSHAKGQSAHLPHQRQVRPCQISISQERPIPTNTSKLPDNTSTLTAQTSSASSASPSRSPAASPISPPPTTSTTPCSASTQTSSRPSQRRTGTSTAKASLTRARTRGTSPACCTPNATATACGSNSIPTTSPRSDDTIQVPTR